MIIAAAFPVAASAVTLRYPLGQTTDATPQFEWIYETSEDSLGIETSVSPAVTVDPAICDPAPPPGCFADGTIPGWHFFRVFPDDAIYRVDEDDAYPPGTYYWHVLVEDEVSGYKYFSSTGSFTVLDTKPPNTTITKGAPNKTKKTKVKFTFKSSESRSRFQCKLDNKGWKACTSPTTIKKLSKGKHTFMVRAADAEGNKDESPAKDKFKVVAKK
jgi:hypothetical protein